MVVPHARHTSQAPQAIEKFQLKAERKVVNGLLLIFIILFCAITYVVRKVSKVDIYVLIYQCRLVEIYIGDGGGGLPIVFLII